MITGIAHINLVVPRGTLDLAKDFYSGTLGFHIVNPPEVMKDVLAWYAAGRFTLIYRISNCNSESSFYDRTDHLILGSI